jgi:hypothetical protein
VTLGSLALGNGTGTNGGLASNYTFSGGTQTASITTASIAAVTGITAANKVYDATADATLNTGSAAFTGRLGADALAVATATGAFTDKNVANGKTVNISGITLAGADAGNYTLANSTASTTANITPKALTTSVIADDKVYDGTTAASISSLVSMLGILPHDDVSPLLALGAFDTANVGVNKPVEYIISLSGADAGNYTATGTTTASITPVPVEIIIKKNDPNLNLDLNPPADPVPPPLPGMVDMPSLRGQQLVCR